MNKYNVLIIPKSFLEEIVKRAKESRIEICGVLLGIADREGRVIVKKLWKARNIKNSPVLFEIYPEDLYKAVVLGEKEGLDIVALYHSHPAPPVPSNRDIEGMKLWPVPWLIVSSIDGSYDCFVLELDKNVIKRVRVVVGD
ncbi:MAG: Mov34/MPN/PAD-1 family protein [Candidatus Njordarchaeales archaeon]